MSHRAILALSAALTAFVLILAGAAASYALRSDPAASAKESDAVPAEVVRTREAEYRRLLDDANARLRAQQMAFAAASEPEPQAPAAPAVFARGDDDRDGEDDEDDDERPHVGQEGRWSDDEDDHG